MNKISAIQMTEILLLSSAFSLMCFSFSIGAQSLSAVLLLLPIQATLCLPMLLLYRKGFSLEGFCQVHPTLLPLLFTCYFILRGGISFLLLWQASERLSLPFSEPLVTAILIGGVCLYTSSLGLKTFARSSAMVFGFFLVTLVILLLGAYQRIDLMNLLPSPDTDLWDGSLNILSLADTLPILFILLNFTKEKRLSSSLWFLGLQALLWVLIFLLCLTVLGSLLPDAPYPFFLLIAVSQPLSSQRADAVYLMVFVMLCVMRLTLLNVLSAHLLSYRFPKLRFRSVLTMGGMILSALLFSLVNYTGNHWCIIGIVLLGTVLPLVLLLCYRRHPCPPSDAFPNKTKGDVSP